MSPLPTRTPTKVLTQTFAAPTMQPLPDTNKQGIGLNHRHIELFENKSLLLTLSLCCLFTEFDHFSLYLSEDERKKSGPPPSPPLAAENANVWSNLAKVV